MTKSNAWFGINRAHQYIVEGFSTSATSGINPLLDRTNNTQSAPFLTDSFTPQVLRYVSFTVTGVATYRVSWYSIQEIEVVFAGSVASNNNIDLNGTIKILPNPFDDYINIDTRSKGSDRMDVKMFDPPGRRILSAST